LFGDRRPKPYLQTPFSEYQGRISPDGRWIAYASAESGAFEVYLQSFPSPGRKRRILTSGGVEPQWRRDGKELFYLSTDHQIMSVNVTDSARNPAAPTPLFRVRVTGAARNHYLVAADGQRFLISAVDDRSQTSITVALNWTSHLTQH
jgi:Tol biopolymer transport system component